MDTPPSATTRDALLERIRRSLAAGRREAHVRPGQTGEVPTPPAIPEEIVRQIRPAPPEALWERFSAKLTALGDSTHLAETYTGAGEILAGLLQEKHYRKGIADPDVFPILGIREEQIGPASVTPAGDRKTSFYVQFGVTLCALGIAETGSIVIANGEGRARLTSLAPRIHYAILPLSRLVPDIFDVEPRMRGISASCTVWITGSSRTADIEGILIHGMHGPAHVTVIGVRGE